MQGHVSVRRSELRLCSPTFPLHLLEFHLKRLIQRIRLSVKVVYTGFL